MLTYTWRRPRPMAWTNAAWLAGYSGGSRLPVDVRESDEAYEITAAVPGRQAEDVEIQVLEDVVTLRLRPLAEETPEPDYLVKEIGEREGERSFRLPLAVDAAKAEAVVENGLLHLRLPKAETVRPKTITVTGK
ncbi:MAG TPA: Hsp20/alpha crystallin family protein [Anaerolineales bacterium]|nr:Hsp20/alpha crystallin family protein [Anaerolineales bacterium]